MVLYTFSLFYNSITIHMQHSDFLSTQTMFMRQSPSPLPRQWLPTLPQDSQSDYPTGLVDASQMGPIEYNAHHKLCMLQRVSEFPSLSKAE